MAEPAMKPKAPESLSDLRAEIDQIDDRIMKLLEDRMQVVQRVGALKKEQAEPGHLIRSGREGSMLRRIYDHFKGTPFHPVAAANIWRLIIAAATNIETALNLSVTHQNDGDNLVWYTREYFGSFGNYTLHPSAARVVADVVNQPSTIGVVPVPSFDEADSWWPQIATDAPNMPKIFAMLPGIRTANMQKLGKHAFAIAKIKPEASGQDLSYFAMQTDDTASTSKLNSAWGEAGFEHTLLHVIAPPNGMKQALVRVKGFVAAEDANINKLRLKLGNSLVSLVWLGAHPEQIEHTA